VPVPALRTALRNYLRRMDCPAPYVFLGVDIGGTLTKFQLYELCLDRGDFVEKGENFKILTTPKKKDSQAQGSKVEDSAADFASRLVKTIAANLAPNRIGPQNIVAIGLSWPGPVRANQVAGTSGIFRNFPPLSTIIDQNRREDVHRLDIVGAVRKAWSPLCATTSIALLNDGDADGTGVLHALAAWQDGQEAGEETPRVAVVKLGTGTAGALFRGGRLEPGLNEWGKLVLDLGAARDRGFPRGLANGYLSSKTLPGLVRRRIGRRRTALLDVADLDSLELGLLLEAGAAGLHGRSFRGKAFRRLRDQACGIKEFAGRGAPEGVDAEVIRRVLERGAAAEPELFPTLELYVGLLGMEARKELQKKVELYGKVRLARLLQLQGEDFRQIGKGWPRIRKALQQAYEVACECAADLGIYLGDFIVLLHDLAEVRTVIVGGGVLSGRTGELVRGQAADRVRLYGLRCELDGPVLRLARRDEPGPAAATPSRGRRRSPDTGTLGAAVHAASEFLFERKQEGMREIKAELMGLQGNQSLTLLADRVLCDQREPLPLSQYALSREDVEDFLRQYGADLGFRRSTGGDPDRIVYTRWIREN
jgi:hypothetical protein